MQDYRIRLNLAPGLQLRTRLAGVFLFLPLLARLRLDRIVDQAGYPGSKMAPAILRTPCAKGLDLSPRAI